MLKLNQLIDQYGNPDILIDSFNNQSKRYAIWGFDEVLELQDKGLFLNNKFINEDLELYTQTTINRWKEESQHSHISCVGFLAYEFKNYLYKHINFQNKLNNSFPYFWFCKPKIISSSISLTIFKQSFFDKPKSRLIESAISSFVIFFIL